MKLRDTLLAMALRLFSAGVVIPLGSVAVRGELTWGVVGVMAFSAFAVTALLFLARRLEK